MVSCVRRPGIGVGILVTLLLAISGVAASAPEESGAAAAAAAADEHRQPKPNERVCRTVQVTGSLMRQRVCLKQRQWDQLREQAQRSVQEANPSARPESDASR